MHDSHVINELLGADKRILTSEPKDVFIDSFAESGMILGIRAWVKTEEYWNTLWDLRENLKELFDANGIEIPYNRLDVNVLNEKDI